jgi:hypothetical protein
VKNHQPQIGGQCKAGEGYTESITFSDIPDLLAPAVRRPSPSVPLSLSICRLSPPPSVVSLHLSSLSTSLLYDKSMRIPIESAGRVTRCAGRRQVIVALIGYMESMTIAKVGHSDRLTTVSHSDDSKRWVGWLTRWVG